MTLLIWIIRILLTKEMMTMVEPIWNTHVSNGGAVTWHLDWMVSIAKLRQLWAILAALIAHRKRCCTPRILHPSVWCLNGRLMTHVIQIHSSTANRERSRYIVITFATIAAWSIIV